MFGLAILDVNLNGKMSFPAADILVERGIPLIFASGYAGDSFPAAFRSTPRLQKPFQIETLSRAIAAARDGMRHWRLVRQARRPDPGHTDALDAANHVMKVPQGPTAFASLAGRRRGFDHGCGRSGPVASCPRRMLRAMNHGWERVFRTDRKETHWGKRKLKRDQ